MERLILQYSVSDGCTYSTDVTLPVLFESKEALERHLQDAVQGFLAQRAAHTQALEAYEAPIREVHEKLRRLPQRARNQTERQALEQKLAELLRARHDTPSPQNTLQLGPHQIILDELLGEDDKVYLPDVYTLDEFFEQAV